MKSYRILMGLVVWTSGLLSGAVCHATDIKGTISSTLTLTQDSRLVGDVNCNVPLTTADANGFSPCIAFGASHITLSLNGHTLTGPVNPLTNVSKEPQRACR
jgi:L-fucose isomerase-like protein